MEIKQSNLKDFYWEHKVTISLFQYIDMNKKKIKMVLGECCYNLFNSLLFSI